MEERPPGGVPGDVDGDSGDISGWLSSSSVVGGTVGPQRMDITERILRHTGGALEGGTSRLSHGRGLADQLLVAPLRTSHCGTDVMDGHSLSSTTSAFVGATTGDALRVMQREFDVQSAARGLTSVLGQTTGDLREVEGSAHSSAERISPRRQRFQLLVNAVVTRSMRAPRPRGQPTRFDSDIIEALLQLDPGTAEDDLAFELKAHAATEPKASLYYAELKQMLGEARSATQDSTPVLGVEPREYATRLPVGTVSEAFGKWTEASPTASTYEAPLFTFGQAPTQFTPRRGRSPARGDSTQGGSFQQPSSQPPSRLPSRSRSTSPSKAVSFEEGDGQPAGASPSIRKLPPPGSVSPHRGHHRQSVATQLAQEQDELARLVSESGPHCDALQLVLKACNEADGLLFVVGRAFMRSAYKPPLPFLNYRRVAATLVDDLQLLPDVYSDELMFEEALRKAVEAEIRSALRASQTGPVSVTAQAPSGPLPPSVSQRYEAASAILDLQPGHRAQLAGSECGEVLMAACNPASAGSTVTIDEATRQAVLADYLRSGVVQCTPGSTMSALGSATTSPVLTTPLPPTAVPAAAAVLTGSGAAVTLTDTPFYGAPTSQAPPSLPPSACGSTPSNISVPSTGSSNGAAPTLAAQLERAASSARGSGGAILEEGGEGGDGVEAEFIEEREEFERAMGQLRVEGSGGVGRSLVHQPNHAVTGRPVSGGALSVPAQLIQLGVPSSALGVNVIWFDYTPDADRRSASLQPARRTILELQAAFLHRELRRHRRIPVEPYTFTAQKLASALRYGNGQKRLFASTRGKLHVDLMEWRYELATRDGSLTSAMETMISVFAAAVHSVAALSTVEEEVDTLAHHGVADDDMFYKMLRVAEYELLPSGDSDDSIFLLVTWHPTSNDTHAVRTAFSLLTKLRSLAVSNQQGGHDELILRYFRVHVEKARLLSNLVLDSTRRSLPSLIYEAYLTTERRATYDTVAKLARALKESSSIGMSTLVFAPIEDVRGPGRTRQPTVPALAAAGTSGEPPPAPGTGGESAPAPATVPAPAALALAVSCYAAARQPFASARLATVTVPERARDQLHYIDLVKAWEFASIISLRITVGGGAPQFVTLSEISDTPPELWNAADPAGLGEYGAADIGACPICVLLRPDADTSERFSDFFARYRGGPTGPNGARPVANNVILTHHLDQCRPFWFCIDNCCSRAKVPLALAVSLDHTERARRMAASKARATGA